MSEMEIIFDAKAHAADMGLVLGEDHEVLPDSDWILWARRFSGIDDLFVYHHKVADTFVLAKWIYHPKKDGVGILMELEAFDSPPNWRPPTQDWMRERLRPAQEIAESMRNGIRDRAKAKRVAEREAIEEKHGVADWLKRQGHEEASMSVRNKKWSNNDNAEFGEFKQNLLNSAKGRIITGG
tara:strand:+ start:194 stop:739 length:546 start_codon:yes stop_codon:yes gene_type:complete